ncbi:MAG TPA: 3'-5' exonuclease [Meiothermus sp.]|jgi:DNA polymerase-3 subunit epsilon|nr:3'-5' exonuclease [Meiothermus sp.]
MKPIAMLKHLLRRTPAPPWEEAVYWALDLETSGLKPEDQILSVGMIPIRGGAIRYGEHFYSLVRPERFDTLSLEGLRAHHIRPFELRQAPELCQVLTEVQRRLEAGILLVHHAPVDVAFLKRAYARCGLSWPEPQVADTLKLLQKLGQRRAVLEPHAAPPPGNLGEARAFLGLPPYTAHHALTDALATAELFLALRARLGARTLRELV